MARDYIDVAAALRHYTVAQLLELARRQDPGLVRDDVLDVGGYLDRFDDKRFGYYGLTGEQIAALRRQLGGSRARMGDSPAAGGATMILYT